MTVLRAAEGQEAGAGQVEEDLAEAVVQQKMGVVEALAEQVAESLHYPLEMGIVAWSPWRSEGEVDP